jgi:arylsulfatase A-like enzyme
VLGESIERLSPGDDQRLVERSLRWMKEQRSPFFLFAHLMDSHTPYRHAPIDGRRRGGRQIEFPAPGLGMTREEAEDVVARYEGGVRSTDRAVGRLLDAMAARRRPWLLIITSDHGESLGESGRWFHGGSLARELLEVPLLVAGTGIEPGRFDAVVGHADIPTTLAAAAGLDCPGCPHRGLDLRTSRGGGAAEGGLPPHLRYRIENDLKLVLDGQSGRRLLFDLRNDPEEAHDLAPQLADLAADFAARMGRELHADAFQPSPEDLERLRAVGYVGDTAGHSGSR